MKDLRIGLIGCGFMGRAHSNAYNRLTNFFSVEHRPVLQAVYGLEPPKTKVFAEAWGYKRIETEWQAIIDAPDIDAVDICAPNSAHASLAIAAAKAGKIVLCEKPLARNAAEGQPMVDAVEAAGVPNLCWFNYRRVPAITLAKQLIDEGKVGHVYHFRTNFLQDWTISADVPQGGDSLWRLDVKTAGSGVTGDLLAHNIDVAMWLNGPITRVTAKTETFVKERVNALTGKVEPVGIDDACLFLAEFANGSLGLFESTRYARGHKALKTFEINGALGSIRFNLEEMEYLDYFNYKSDSNVRGWRRIHVTNGEHPYMDRYWVPGLVVGYEHSTLNTLYEFVSSIDKGTTFQPNFRTALQTSRVCDAVLESGRTGQWVATGVEL